MGDAYRIAVLSDIHGNSDALRAVYAEIDREPVDRIVNLGDHFSGPLDASGTASLLRERDILSIRGNHDRWLCETDPDQMAPSDAVAYEQLSEADIAWLATLPAIRVEANEVFMCHGTPRSDTTYWLEAVGSDGGVFRKDLTEIRRDLDGLPHALFLCGHSHLPRALRLPDGPLIVNPGSVGCPGYTDNTPFPHAMESGLPFACFAIVEQRKGTWSVDLRAIPYDAGAMAELADRRNRPEWAHALRTGWISSG